MQFIQAILDYLKKEGAVIKEAPFAFIGMGLLLLFCTDQFYRQRLSALNELVKIYEQKMGMAPYDKTLYANKTNAELKSLAKDLAAQIRQFYEPLAAKEDLARRQDLSALSGLADGPEQRRIAQLALKNISDRAAIYLKEFNSQFGAKPNTALEEMYSRVPTLPRRTVWMMGIEGAQNMADELQRVAEYLP